MVEELPADFATYAKIRAEIDSGQTVENVAASLGISQEKLGEIVAFYETPLCQQKGPAVFRKILDYLTSRVVFMHEWEATMVSLFIMQAYIAEILPGVFYLAIPGAKGTGKSKLLRLIRNLTNGIMVENISVAAFARGMKYGRTVCIDEYDADRGEEWLGVMNALIRSGYHADAPPYTRWNANKNCLEEFPIFGPKAVVYRGNVDDALLDRAYVIPTMKDPVGGEAAYDKVTSMMCRTPEEDALVADLKDWADSVAAHLKGCNLRDIIRSRHMYERVARFLDGVPQVDRETELAVYVSTTVYLAGLDPLVNSMAAARKYRLMEDDIDERVEVENAILSTLVSIGASQGTDPVIVPQKLVRDRINESRRALGEKAMSTTKFRILRRELGISDSWVDVRHHCLIWKLPRSFVDKLFDSNAWRWKDSRECTKMSTLLENPLPLAIDKWGDGEAKTGGRRAGAGGSEEEEERRAPPPSPPPPPPPSLHPVSQEQRGDDAEMSSPPISPDLPKSMLVSNFGDVSNSSCAPEFEVEIRRAQDMYARGVPVEEIVRSVGSVVYEHCLRKGYIPAVGGRYENESERA